MVFRSVSGLVLLISASFLAESCNVFADEPQESKASTSAPTTAAPLSPRVSRVQLKLVVDGEVVDVIEKGDLLTVIEEREENFLVRTYSGRKGVVAKVNAVPIAESADVYTELIEQSPKEGRLYTLRAGAYWEQGKQVEALADFNQAIELGYTQPHAYVSRALFQAAIGEYDKAIADYAIAIEKEPENVSHYVNRAAVYMTMNEFTKAKDDYDKAISIDDKNPTLYQQRAVTLKAMNLFDASIEDFNRALELDNKNLPVLMGRGFVYFQMGKHQDAVNDFGKVIELNSKAAVAFNNRGYNLQQLGKEAEALKDFDEAIKLAPEYGLALQNLAWLLVTSKDESLRDPQRAIELAKKACELSEYKNAGDIAAFAASHAAAGDFDVAVGWQEKVVTLVTDDQLPFAKAILTLYQSEKPYDAKAALGIVESAKQEAAQK